MKRALMFSTTVIAAVYAAKLLSPTAFAQEIKPNVLDAAGLKTAIEGLGYEVSILEKEAGKEKYEFKIVTADLNVPMAAEISPSKNYIWLTVRLGDNRSDLKWEELLKNQAKVQPCQFYITTTNRLMFGVAIDNRAVNAAVLKRNVDMISKNVGETKALWLKA
jgi:hypothetical protein